MAPVPARQRVRGSGGGSVLRTLGAGVLGFVSGVVFWHAVGFWGLVNEAVFHQRGDGPAASAAPSTRTAWVKAQARHVGAAGPVPAATETCSEASPNVDASVSLRECKTSAVKFFVSHGIERADFADFGLEPVPKIINSVDKSRGVVVGAPAVSGWAAQVDTAGPPSVR